MINILSFTVIVLTSLLLFQRSLHLKQIKHQLEEEKIKNQKLEEQLRKQEPNNPASLVCISEDITKEKKSHQLLQAISLAQSQFIADVNPTILFNDLLQNLLILTESEYSFIGEVFYSKERQT